MILARRRHQGLLALTRHATVFQRWQSRASDSEPVEIQLTPAEEKLFEVLQFVRKKYAPTTTLRVAGGWVRDKVLGIPSDDIDIALDTMTGEAFVKKILAFQKACGVPIKGFYVVKKNTEQSKHLECAAIKLLGHELDFVHLRNETYNDPTSRIPSLSDVLATPKEDAMRRDITINALFYNLNTKTVEDFTGQGVLDLHRQVIRTPLAPTETFLDDPLRVLRAIRFASHYNFKLHPSLVQAMQTEPVQVALSQKVTRERVGIEVRKMLSGSNPTQALHWLRHTNLLPIVLPTFLRSPVDDTTIQLPTVEFVQAAVVKTTDVTYAMKDQFDHRLMLAAALAPSRTWFTPSDDGEIDVPPRQPSVDAARHEAMKKSMLRCLTAVVFPILHRRRPEADDDVVSDPCDGLLDDDAVLVQSAFAFLGHSNALDKHHQSKQRTDAIKKDLKWSNVDARHASDVIEGYWRFHELATFLLETTPPADQGPPQPSDSASRNKDELTMVVALSLWCQLHGPGVLHHILPILWQDTYLGGEEKGNSELHTNDVNAVRALLATAETIAFDHQTRQRTLLPAPAIQKLVNARKGSKWQLSVILRVVAAWEWLHPSASTDDERAFVQNALAPIVTSSSNKT